MLPVAADAARSHTHSLARARSFALAASLQLAHAPQASAPNLLLARVFLTLCKAAQFAIGFLFSLARTMSCNQATLSSVIRRAQIIPDGFIAHV